MWEYIIAFAGVLFTGIGVLIAFLTLSEKKKQRRIAEYRREQRERDKKEEDKLKNALKDFKSELKMDFKEEMIEVIEEHVLVDHEGLITVVESRREHERIWNQLKKIEESLQNHFNQSAESELTKLAHDIVSYADDLRVGVEKSRVSYKNISHCYDRYKRLGGNHFIDGEFAYIKRRMGEIYDGEN